MKRLLPVVMFLAVSCSAPASAPPAETPDPTPTPGRYTDAEKAAIFADSVNLVFGTAPQPDWYPVLILDDGGLPRVETDGQWAYLHTLLSPGDEAIAEVICTATAPLVYDDEAEPTGITDILIYAADGSALADCDSPNIRQ